MSKPNRLSRVSKRRLRNRDGDLIKIQFDDPDAGKKFSSLADPEKAYLIILRHEAAAPGCRTFFGRIK
jgi:hypothetical protein